MYTCLYAIQCTVVASSGQSATCVARTTVIGRGLCFPHPLKLLPFYADPAGRQLLPFYADNRAQLLPIFASGAPRRAAHSHRHAHRTRGLAHEHAPPAPRTRRGTRRHNMHGTPWHSVTPHAHTHSPTHWAAHAHESESLVSSTASRRSAASRSAAVFARLRRA